MKVPISALLGRPSRPDDIERILCGTSLDNLSDDKSRQEAILARTRTFCNSFFNMVISILCQKDKNEKRTQGV